jgi:AraC-like DNA-binding protein
MDPLSEALRQIHLRSTRYIRMELSAPWALGYPPGSRGVHLIASGRCELRWADGRGQPVPLETGDLVVVPNGRGHHLRSPGARGRATDVGTLLGDKPTCPTHHGGGGEPTSILCGQFIVDEEVEGLAFRALPEIIVLRKTHEQPVLSGLIAAIRAEVIEDAPGSQLVIARLSDALIVHALRHHARELPGAGWLAALHDTRLGPVIGQLHQRPEHGWTVESMARTSGMSRAAFAARFNEQVGEPPLKYLTRVRMHRAQSMLRDGDSAMSDIAQAAGYGSEAAFSTAFRRWTGVPPATYRRQHEQARAAS